MRWLTANGQRLRRSTMDKPEYSYVGVGWKRTFRPEVKAYDFDGVVSEGIHIPRWQHDIIISGRTFQESAVIYDKMEELGIKNAVYFNPIHYKDRGDHTVSARTSSGTHKAAIISMLFANKVNLVEFFEDDFIQADIIKEAHPTLKITLVESKVQK